MLAAYLLTHIHANDPTYARPPTVEVHQQQLLFAYALH